MITSKKRYIAAAVVLFIVEVLIALFIHDRLVRPHGGDFLVVIFLYCVVRAFTKASVAQAGVGVLLFAFAVETSQYFHLIQHLGLEHSTLAHLILGSQFEWLDLLAYTLGIGLVLIVETSIRRSRATT